MALEISDRTAKGRRRVRGRPFLPGVSGNPGGRPRALVDVQELARAHTADAVRALVSALDSPRERVSAAVALLDRGWGKPTQHLASDAGGPLVAVCFEWAPAASAAPVDEHATINGDAVVEFAESAGDVAVPRTPG